MCNRCFLVVQHPLLSDSGLTETVDHEIPRNGTPEGVLESILCRQGHLWEWALIDAWPSADLYSGERVTDIGFPNDDCSDEEAAILPGVPLS